MSDCNEKTYLPASYEPTGSDVICARGKDAFFHEGNKLFRDMIESHLPQYIKADTKLEKSSIVMEIVGQIRSNADTGFVRFCNRRKTWYEIGEEAAREKVGQTIRETLTQRDPKKRANKRMKRAINKAKRDAAKEATLEGLDLEPLPVVDQMLSLRYFSQFVANQQQAAQRTPLSLPSSFSLANRLQQQVQNNVSSFQPRFLADERVLPIAQTPFSASNSLDLANLMAASSNFSFANLGQQPQQLEQTDQKQVPRLARGVEHQDTMIPPPPALLSRLSTKDFESLLTTTRQPSLSFMSSREWAMQEGFTKQEYATMENLYEQHERKQRESSLPAAAC